jgi:hypothetical protein
MVQTADWKGALGPDGLRAGEGTVTYPNTTYTYTGNFAAGVPDGHGTLTIGTEQQRDPLGKRYAHASLEIFWRKKKKKKKKKKKSRLGSTKWMCESKGHSDVPNCK